MERHPKVRINGKIWRDAGADVNWTAHGGTWTRQDPEDPNIVWALRLDVCDLPRDHQEWWAPVADVVPVDVSDPIRSVCVFAEVPWDRLDDYGRPIPDDVWRSDYAAAYIAFWGVSGPHGGETRTDPHPYRARSYAARALE